VGKDVGQAIHRLRTPVYWIKLELLRDDVKLGTDRSGIESSMRTNLPPLYGMCTTVGTTAVTCSAASILPLGVVLIDVLRLIVEVGLKVRGGRPLIGVESTTEPHDDSVLVERRVQPEKIDSDAAKNVSRLFVWREDIPSDGLQ
jgi:hypothetical protein